MRIPLPLAWLLLIATFGTAALLRQFHDSTPLAPNVSPVVGSALFAAIFLLLLVTARELRRKVPSEGSGIRLVQLTPIMLFLLVEKWVSIFIYPTVFNAIAPRHLDPRFADALFRAFAGVSLIIVCVVIGFVTVPTLRKTWRRARPARWPAAALGLLCVVAGGYFLLGALSAALGGELKLALPENNPLFVWIVGGQSLLAFSEELYYRGLLLWEMLRLAPLLGIHHAAGRRWLALGSTSLLFGLEHLRLGPPWDRSFRELVFVVSLGLLFGILVMVSSNLHYAAGVHAWINWLLLGAAPYFVDSLGRAALPAGTYIGVTLILAFLLTYTVRLWNRRVAYREPLLES